MSRRFVGGIIIDRLQRLNIFMTFKNEFPDGVNSMMSGRSPPLLLRLYYLVLDQARRDEKGLGLPLCIGCAGI